VGVNKAHTDRPQAYASLTTVYGWLALILGACL